MKNVLAAVLLPAAWLMAAGAGASDPHDWPMWNYAPDRRGDSPAVGVLPPELHLHWRRGLPAPRRAWRPQRDDRDKLEFDLSYAPIAMGGMLFVPSMVTDSVTAYDAATGEEIWRRVVDGPVRFAPVGWNGRVYVASDDGNLYCLDAGTGATVWVFHAARSSRRVLGNERVISIRPVRGGPVIMDGAVYCAAGIWPFQGVFIYALDAATGKVLWSNTTTGSEWGEMPHGGADAFGGIAPQGHMAASADRLVVPGGRSLPALLNRRTGALIHHDMRHPPKGSGGHVVQIDGSFFYNDGRRYNLSDGGDAVSGTLPPPPAMARALELRRKLDSAPFAALAARGRLYVTTLNGTLYCFGGPPEQVRRHAYAPLPPSGGAAAGRAAELLDASGARAGYALVLGLGDGDLIEQLAVQSDLHVVGMDTCAQTVAALRRRFGDAGLYGSRIHLLAAEPGRIDYPPYISSLIVAESPEALGFIAEIEGVVMDLLRPYGGKGFVGDAVVVRAGALPGAGQWTHQYADPANTVTSADDLVRPPLGTLWFGGPSNENVLPRHAVGPRPQVAGGRLVILGVETISARDVYTGRQIWEREFPGIGHPFTNLALEDTYRRGGAVYMSNIPGATYIGSPYVTLPDSIYLRHGSDVHRLCPDTGATLAVFRLPGSGKGNPRDWGHVSVHDDMLIATCTPHVLDEEKLTSNRQDLGWNNWNSTSSAMLIVLDRYTGRMLWERKARMGFQHNAIVSSGGRIYLIDGVCEPVRKALERRGLSPSASTKIAALDAVTGRVLWEQGSQVYGTFLGYSSAYDILVEGGTHDGRSRRPDEPWKPRTTMTARRGRDGTLLWERSGAMYAGPVAIHGAVIYPGRPGAARSLLTGENLQASHPLTGEASTWSYSRDYGCGTLNASTHLLLFRSGAAGFVDLTLDGGTGTLGGFRAGCTASMIAADGVLNAPDYTRTCTCSYQNKTSLALVHMPEMEYWTRVDSGTGSGPIRQVGVNLGAPGNRRAPDGVMWLHFPRGGAATPDISVAVQPAGASYFRRHSALVEDGDGMGWVSASGVEGVESLILDRLTGDRVALVFAEPNPSMGVGGRVFDIHIGGRLVESAFDIVREAGGADRGIRRSYDVEVGGALIVDLKPARDSAPALLCGVEVTSCDLRAPLSITYPTASSTGVYTVAWTAVLGAESYRLVRSSDGGRTWESVYTGPATSYTEAAASGNHRYRVRAQNSAGRSRWRTGTVDGVVRIASIDPVNARSGAQGGAADAERLGSGSGARESAQAAGAEPLPAPDQAP